MKIEIGYGKETQILRLDKSNLLGILKPNQIEINLRGQEEVVRSINNPIDSGKLETIINKDDKIAIVTSDITRPCPSHIILPVILDKLDKIGVKNENISIVFALGSHRKHREEEKIALVGEEIYNNYRCIDSDMEDVVYLGQTKAGTPVEIFSEVAKADKRICVGNIEYHYFAGYSGGAKAIMPGVSTKKAIQANHSKMVKPSAIAGQVENNEVRDDLEDAIESFINIDFIVNVVLDENKEIIKCVSGHYKEAHRQGCKFLDKIYKKDIREKVDIIVVSQGGYPKDIDLYQSQKALDNAKHAIKDKGIIILVGECSDGFGNETFKEWMIDAKTPKEIIKRIQKEFVLGGHKAAAIAQILQKADIYLVSEMDPQIVESIFMQAYRSLQEAYDKALEIKGKEARVLIMPYGGSTLPNLI